MRIDAKNAACENAQKSGAVFRFYARSSDAREGGKNLLIQQSFLYFGGLKANALKLGATELEQTGVRNCIQRKNCTFMKLCKGKATHHPVFVDEYLNFLNTETGEINFDCHPQPIGSCCHF